MVIHCVTDPTESITLKGNIELRMGGATASLMLHSSSFYLGLYTSRDAINCILHEVIISIARFVSCVDILLYMDLYLNYHHVIGSGV